MQFKEWLDKYEESTLGNLLAIGGMALGTGGDTDQTNPQQAAMVQAPKKERPVFIHGTRLYVTVDKAEEIRKKAIEAVDKIEKFETIILPMMKNETGDFKRIWKPGENLGNNEFVRDEIKMSIGAGKIDQLLQHYKDKLRVLASYSPEQISKGFIWGRDRDQQDRINIKMLDVEEKLLNPLLKLNINMPNIRLVHPEALSPKRPDPRNDDEKKSDNELAKYAPWITAIDKIEKNFDHRGQPDMTSLDAVLNYIETGAAQ